MCYAVLLICFGLTLGHGCIVQIVPYQSGLEG